MRARALLAGLAFTLAARGTAGDEPHGVRPAAGAEPPPLRVQPRPRGRLGGVVEVAVFGAAHATFEAVLDDLPPGLWPRLCEVMGARGLAPLRRERWLGATPEDLEALVAGGGSLPEGYVPRGLADPEALPPFLLLGASVELRLVGGEARAVLTAVPKGSKAQKIGLREGDAVLEVGGRTVGPAVLLESEVAAELGTQQTLRVRRSHGEIERIVLESWAPRPAQR